MAGNVKLMTSAGGGVVLDTATTTATDVTVKVPVTGVNNGTLVCSDSSGNVGIGTSSPSTLLHLASATDPTITIQDTNESTLKLTAGGNANIESSGAIIVRTGGTSERMRIDSSGNLLAGITNANWGGGHTLANNSSGANPLAVVNQHGTTPYGSYFYFSGAAPNNTTNYFLLCADVSTSRLIIYSNGTVSNRTGTYNTISDLKIKQDVIDAGSQWDDIKAIRFRKYRLKDDVSENPDAPYLLGVVAQELEQTSPGLVDDCPDTTRDSEGNIVETGESTKSVKQSVLLMKAAKALQEALLRIETLESKVAALEAK